MLAYLQNRSGGRVRSCLLTFILLILASGGANAQTSKYDPNIIFKGLQFSIDFRMATYFKLKYYHDSGFKHPVSTRNSYGYEVGFTGHYHFNKHFSMQVGLMAGSARNLNWDVYITKPGHLEDLAESQDEFFTLIELALKDFEWSQDRLKVNISLPVSLTYHQYFQSKPRHRLDYSMGVAIRYYPPVRLLAQNVVEVAADRLLVYEEARVWWHVRQKPSIDLQPSFGYTYVLENQNALKFSIMANLAFAKDRTAASLTILEKSSFNETGHFKISNHYIGIQFGYLFTTPPGKKRKKDKRQD